MRPSGTLIEIRPRVSVAQVEPDANFPARQSVLPDAHGRQYVVSWAGARRPNTHKYTPYQKHLLSPI